MILTQKQKLIVLLGLGVSLCVLALLIYFIFIKKDTPKLTPKPTILTPKPTILTPKPTILTPTPTILTPTPTNPQECSNTNWLCASSALNPCKCKVGTVCNGLRCVAPLSECSDNSSFCMLGMEELCKCKVGTVCDGIKCIPGTEKICLDSTPYCPLWASTGECTKNPIWMKENCKKSCNSCDVPK